MRLLSLFLIFCLGLFTACGGENTAAVEEAAVEAAQAAQQEAHDLMMEGHDRAMGMMGKITAAQKALQEQIDTEGIEASRKDLLTAAYEQLEDAHDGMMTWMGEIKPLDELRASMNNEAIITYLKEETADIAKVESDIMSAIAKANELLGVADHDHGDGADHDHDHGDGHDHKH
ncbi:hypothetical protein [Lewinella sp. W8]|uniref:hypothetical protein n=1 Tax=Lewinella sp. W8 TaxID=2528208 RepID=UPI001068A5DE|nr:hypothetical protein [Lewinella sp. W8]MTB51921.1 hypothetical protein [Lewinella sp. W8]